MENFHERIEDEFYDIERFSNSKDFLGKAYTFSLWFNLERPNMAFKKMPWQMVQESGIDNPNFLNFPPVVLDALEIDAHWMLSERRAFLSEYAKLMPFVYCRSTKGESSGYHVSDDHSKSVFIFLTLVNNKL